MDIKKWYGNLWHVCTRFTQFVVNHFVQDDCAYIASALAFTSLLALVPLMSLSLAIFTSFPAFESYAKPLEDFIFANFVPASGQVVQGYLESFTAQVSRLSLFGVLFLLSMALLMMYTIEQAMNKIWRASSSRQGVSAFLLYWAILSLAPVILGLSIVLSSYLLSNTSLTDNTHWSMILSYSPFFLSLIGFLVLYTIVPNCRVYFWHAFGGALFASILFEIAKQAFVYYLAHFNPYELLYGAFAIIPIFFIWIYWAWIITLLGAEISYALSAHHQRRNGQALDGFSHALLWLHQLWKNQSSGKGLNFHELIVSSTQPFAVDADEMINALIHHELIHCTADGKYMLSRDLYHLSLYDLTQILPYRAPTHEELEIPDSSLSESWNNAFRKNDSSSQKILAMSIADLFNH